MNRGMPMDLVRPVCKIHAARRRLRFLESSLAKDNGTGWKPPSTFPLSFSPSEQMQEKQRLLETFVPELCDSLHFQNNLPYTNAHDGYMPLEHEGHILAYTLFPSSSATGQLPQALSYRSSADEGHTQTQAAREGGHVLAGPHSNGSTKQM